MADHLYIGQYEWRPKSSPPGWYAPGTDVVGGILGLRSKVQIRAKGPTPQGYGLFVYDGLRNYPELLHYLGSDIEAATSLVDRSAIETLLKLDKKLVSTSLIDIISELFTLHTDPAGLTAHKPVRISRRLGYEISLGRRRIIREPFSEAHPSFQSTIDVFRADYDRNFKAGIDQDVLRKWTGAEQEKLYGRQGSDLDGIIPPEYQLIGSDPPKSQVDDNFNRSNRELENVTDNLWSEFTTAGGDWEIVDNQAKNVAGANSYARYDTDLSSDDHSSQIDWIASPNSAWGGAICRVNNTAVEADIEFYMGMYREANQWELWSYPGGGGYSQLGGDASSNGAPTSTVKVSADTSTIELFRDGVSQGTRSDGTYTGNLRGGMVVDDANYIFDNFIATDLGAPPAVVLGSGLLDSRALHSGVRLVR